jgi:N-acetylneuraminate synthase
MNKIKIDEKFIGKDEPCFIIAEAGINHNGSLQTAKKLVDKAVSAGVDAIKFQTFTPENLVTQNTPLLSYQKQNLGYKTSQLEMLKKVALTNEEFKKIKEYCNQKRIMFLSTPHSIDAIDFLKDLVPAYKLGSGDITNFPALIKAALTGKPIILGTGMSTLQEVKSAIQIIRSTPNHQIILLHCTTKYPCQMFEINLQAMKTMEDKLGCIVGYSDHSLGILVPIIAVALGACVIEKHFTLDKTLPGPDHKASLEPKELVNLVTEIRNVEIVLGSSEKKPTKSEKEIKSFIRKSIVANQFIPKNTILKEHMLIVKRPGIGISPINFFKIIGKKTKKPIEKDEILQFDMVE